MTAFIGRREFITLLGGAARVAARGAGAAASHASDWIFGRQHTFKLGSMDLRLLCRDCARLAGSRAAQ